MNPTTAQSPLAHEEITEADIQARLAGGAVKGPPVFRGRTLARCSAGLRDVISKVIEPADTFKFHDAAFLHILAEAHAATPTETVERRALLISATDDAPHFRALVSIAMDDFSDADFAEARRLVAGILDEIERAKVTVEKKSPIDQAPPEHPPETREPSPTPTPSSSPRSRRKPAGLPTTSAGS